MQEIFRVPSPAFFGYLGGSCFCSDTIAGDFCLSSRKRCVYHIYEHPADGSRCFGADDLSHCFWRQRRFCCYHVGSHEFPFIGKRSERHGQFDRGDRNSLAKGGGRKFNFPSGLEVADVSLDFPRKVNVGFLSKAEVDEIFSQTFSAELLHGKYRASVEGFFEHLRHGAESSRFAVEIFYGGDSYFYFAFVYIRCLGSDSSSVNSSSHRQRLEYRSQFKYLFYKRIKKYFEVGFFVILVRIIGGKCGHTDYLSRFWFQYQNAAAVGAPYFRRFFYFSFQKTLHGRFNGEGDVCSGFGLPLKLFFKCFEKAAAFACFFCGIAAQHTVQIFFNAIFPFGDVVWGGYEPNYMASQGFSRIKPPFFFLESDSGKVLRFYFFRFGGGESSLYDFVRIIRLCRRF